ncbi:MAG TPA: RelA/SpoT domain-containing protein [Rhizobiaceae bacterium]|nr:RelA/SpoT domain-containing protein [Rhizobiaceae bacterium]
MLKSILEQAEDAIAGADEVHNRLRAAFTLASRDGSDFIFYTRSRVKDPKSLADKVLDRQDRYQTPYSVSDATDIVGYRVVVLYDDQLKRALDVTLGVLESCYHINDRLVETKDIFESIHEIKMFPRHFETDPYEEMYEYLCDRFPFEKGKKIKIDKSEENEYSSLHIIVYLNCYGLSSIRKIPVEIQIRTAIEDIWAEVSHKNKYKVKRRDIWSPGLLKLYRDNDRHVRSLKTVMDTTANTLMRDIRGGTKGIYEEISRIRDSRIARYGSTVIDLVYVLSHNVLTNKNRSLLDDYATLIGGMRSKRNKKHFEKMRSILTRIENEAHIDEYKLRYNVSRLLEFEKIRISVSEINLISDGGEEEKLVSLNLDSKSLVQKARELYLQLDSLAADSKWEIKPVSLVELYKYYLSRFSGHAQQSWNHLSSCLDSMTFDPTIGKDHILHVVAPRLMAYETWKQAEADKRYLNATLSAPQLILGLRTKYQDSLRLTLQSQNALKGMRLREARGDLLHAARSIERIVGLNNRIFFAAECRRNGVGDFFFSEIRYSDAELDADIDELEHAIKRAVKRRRASFAHSLMIAFSSLGRRDQELRWAKRLRKGEFGIFSKLRNRVRQDVELSLGPQD